MVATTDIWKVLKMEQRKVDEKDALWGRMLEREKEVLWEILKCGNSDDSLVHAWASLTANKMVTTMVATLASWMVEHWAG